MYSLLCYEKDNYILQLTSSTIHKTGRTAIVLCNGKGIVANIISTGAKRQLTQVLKKLSNNKGTSTAKRQFVATDDGMKTKSETKKIKKVVPILQSNGDHVRTNISETSSSKMRACQLATVNSSVDISGTSQLGIPSVVTSAAQSPGEASESSSVTVLQLNSNPPSIVASDIIRAECGVNKQLSTDEKKLNATIYSDPEAPDVMSSKNPSDSIPTKPQSSEEDRELSSDDNSISSEIALVLYWGSGYFDDTNVIIIFILSFSCTTFPYGSILFHSSSNQ